MEYTTLATLKEYLGITDTASDTLLTNTIKRVTRQFDKYLGRNLGTKEYIEYIDCEDDNIIIISKWPLDSITEIKSEDSSGSDLTVKRTDGNIIYLENSYDGTVYVKYDAGYNDLGDILDVEQSCLEVCNGLWNDTPVSGGESNIKSKKIETLSKTYFSKKEMSEGNSVDFRETLDNYVSLNPVMI